MEKYNLKKNFLLISLCFLISCSLNGQNKSSTTAFDKTLKRLKELSKYNWGIYNESLKEVNKEDGSFKFTSENEVEFSVGCGRNGDIFSCRLSKTKPKNTGLKLEIANPDVYLIGKNNNSSIKQAGSLKIINDTLILAEYLLNIQNVEQVTCGGQGKNIFKLIRLNGPLMGQSKSSKNPDIRLSIFSKEPEWCQNCKHIYLGDYGEYMQHGPGYEGQCIGLVGDEYQKPTEHEVPFVDFICVLINGNEEFLKFNNTTKNKGHIIVIYSTDNKKIVLDYFNFMTASGVGNGGLLKFYYDNVLISTKKFWSD